MPQLYYPKPYVFTDAKRGKEYRGPGSFDVAEDAVEQYLRRGWLRSNPDEESGSSEDTEAVFEASAGPAKGPDDDDGEPVVRSEESDSEVVTDATAESESESEPEPEGEPEPPDDPEPETGDTGGADEPVTTEETDSVDQVEYGDLTISELREVLDANAASMSDEHIRTLIKNEKDAKNRKGALRALRSHLDDDEEE